MQIRIFLFFFNDFTLHFMLTFWIGFAGKVLMVLARVEALEGVWEGGWVDVVLVILKSTSF